MKKVSVRLENFEKTIGVFNAFKLRIDIFGQKISLNHACIIPLKTTLAFSLYNRTNILPAIWRISPMSSSVSKLLNVSPGESPVLMAI